MTKFYRLKIADIHRETADSVSLALDIPQELKNEFKYIQGQYVTLKLQVGGEEYRRSYSICSSPVLNEEFRIAIKRIKDGKVSTYINEQVKRGDMIEVMPPMGKFYTELRSDHEKNYYLFAGGSGITPMLSILKTILHTEPNSRISLFYGNQDESSIIFKNQLDQLAGKHNRLNVYHILNAPSVAPQDELFRGMMTREKIQALLERFVDLKAANEFFICGPTVMMNNVEEVLKGMNVDKHHIHIEYFTADLEPKKPKAETEQAQVDSSVTVILDGEETVLSLKSNGLPILDAALEAGLDVPYACKGAVCCTCRAKIMEGKVQMDMNYALSDEEIAQGYILTCQSHPITPRVVVDYDQP